MSSDIVNKFCIVKDIGGFEEWFPVEVKTGPKTHTTYFSSDEEAISAFSSALNKKQIEVEEDEEFLLVKVCSQLELERSIKVVPKMEKIITTTLKGVK